MHMAMDHMCKTTGLSYVGYIEDEIVQATPENIFHKSSDESYKIFSKGDIDCFIQELYNQTIPSNHPGPLITLSTCIPWNTCLRNTMLQ